MKNSQKGFVNIALVVMVVVLLGVVGYFALVKKSEPVVQEPTPVTGSNTQTSASKAGTYEAPVKIVVSPDKTAKISSVLPSGSIFTQGEGANIPLSWSVENIPAGSTVYLDLLTSDGSESLGRITNNPDCSKGGDTIALATSIKSYKWDGLYVCSNWQAHSVNPGSYKMGVSLYSASGTTIVATGQSSAPFSLKK
jgi:hypothetical protein